MLAGIILLACAVPVVGQHRLPLVVPEECSVGVRDPSQLCSARIPATPAPTTIYDESFDASPQPVALDEAIRIALENAEVVRVLAGVQAVSSGSTIYDPSISATSIEEQKARFDPTVQALNSFNRFESPSATFDPNDPARALLGGGRSDDYNLRFDASKDTITGGTANVGVRSNPTRRRPGVFPLNPSNRSSVELSYTQPLLQGGGIAVNEVPIVLARIDTERSYFRLKDSVQNLVNSVIQAYMNLVQARVDLWARTQQAEQAEFAFDRATKRQKVQMANAGEVAQTELALENFRVSLIGARATVLLREAALRNVLGLPPTDGLTLVPTTPPSSQELNPEWESLVALAEERRPDLIELKLVLEADQQRLLLSDNQARPRLDAVGLYRWNGLEGRMPIGERISTRAGQFTDWTMGVNFSVPIGLRRSRAGLRRQELIIARDRANLNQGMHQVVHQLTINVRNLAQFYRQYELLVRARAAAETNLKLQFKEYNVGRVIFLNVLQAITDWGNAVTAEANALIQYNLELADLERQTGTILETHGVVFFEERFCSLGPLGRRHACRAYPAAHQVGPNGERYPDTAEPAEDSFDLDTPFPKAERRRERGEMNIRPRQVPPVPSSIDAAGG